MILLKWDLYSGSCYDGVTEAITWTICLTQLLMRRMWKIRRYTDSLQQVQYSYNECLSPASSEIVPQPHDFFLGFFWMPWTSLLVGAMDTSFSPTKVICRVCFPIAMYWKYDKTIHTPQRSQLRDVCDETNGLCMSMLSVEPHHLLSEILCPYLLKMLGHKSFFGPLP